MLIGYRETGKSTMAKYLAKLLKMKLYSIDRLIENQIKMPILDYMLDHSWDEFRDIESAIVKKYAEKGPAVIDCGGGVVERKKNIKALKKSGMIFWLKASLPTILQRLNISDERPPLLEPTVVNSEKPPLTKEEFLKDEVNAVLRHRTPLYQLAQDHTIDTEGKSIKELAKEIVGQYHQYNI